MLPDFFIIGAQKAGSTYLLHCLSDHPQVFMPQYEVPFLESAQPEADCLRTFAANFSKALPEQVVGVKRANMLGHSERAADLDRLLPNLKLVATLRHPIERTISGYYHYMSSGFIPIVPIEEGLPRLLDGGYADFPRAADVIDFSMYGKHLSEFERVFSRDRIHVVFLDDVKRDSATQLQKLYHFVGVDPLYRPTSARQQPMRATYSLTRLRLRQPLDRLCREPASIRTSQVYRKGPVATSIRGVNALADRLVWSRIFRNSAPELSSELANRLLDLFRDDVKQLEQLLGRNLSSWHLAPAGTRS